MSETDYLAEVERLPRPTGTQIDAFVDYVATAHSWYKHLPLLPPGIPFFFYVNPNAGKDRMTTDDGVYYRERVTGAPEREQFHYTWQPTTDYIAQFGYLDYYAAAGTSFLLAFDESVLDTGSLLGVHGRSGEWIALPEAIRNAGSVRLTAAVHPLGQDPLLWFRRLGYTSDTRWCDSTLPRQEPDDEILARIVDSMRAFGKGLHTHRGLLAQAKKAFRFLSSNTDKRAATADFEELRTTWLPAYAEREKRQMKSALQLVIQHIYRRT